MPAQSSHPGCALPSVTALPLQLSEMDSYREALQSLSRIRDAVGAQLELPQLCVVGDQTSGKSSLLQELTGVRFPVKTGTCTRVPIVVQTTHAPTAKCELRSGPRSEFVAVDAARLHVEIEKAQRGLLDNLGVSTALTGAATKERSKIGVEELTVRVEGPDHNDLIIVDLPGIIHQGEGEAETKALIERYIKSPQTLILLVSEAKQDEELTIGLSLAKKFDPECKRTLRCLSKFDTFDSVDARIAATKLVVQGENSGLGPHAVVCRAGGGAEYSSDDEQDAFRDNATLTHTNAKHPRMGVKSLRERLPPLFAQLVQTNLPVLADSASRSRDEAATALRRLGDEPLSSNDMLRECQRVLVDSERAFEEELTVAMDAFRETLHASGNSVTEEWVSSHIKRNAFTNPFFYGKDDFDHCLKLLVGQWQSGPQARLCAKVEAALKSALDQLADGGVGVSQRLLSQVERVWSQTAAKITHDVKKAVAKSVLKASEFGTCNHYLDDNFIEEEVLPSEAELAIAARLFNVDKDSLAYCGNRQISYDDVKKAFDEQRKSMSMSSAADLHERTVRKVYRALKATWKTEKKNVCDNVLKDIRDVAMKQRRVWISDTLLTSDDLRQSAVEDDDVCERRAALQSKVCAMQQVIDEIDALGRHAENQCEEKEGGAREKEAPKEAEDKYGFGVPAKGKKKLSRVLAAK